MALIPFVLSFLVACTQPTTKDSGSPPVEQDDDGDGYPVETDCDDAQAAVHPGAAELCNDQDDDCDTEIDELGAADAPIWYLDYDGDGLGGTQVTLAACSAPDGYVANADDCNDLSAASHTDADEICDGLDNDCDGSVDESDAMDPATWYRDSDRDGFGDPLATLEACVPPAGYVADDTDCDDSDAASHPGGDEICDGDDDDCDGSVDENATETWYRDADGDDLGDATLPIDACSQPSGYVPLGTDCDDADPSVHPSATERCNNLDDDCDGVIDDDVPDAPTWYLDYDGDGAGADRVISQACTSPALFVASATDCDDTDPMLHPGAPETCDGRDEDCDGTVDESDAVDAITFHLDQDGDGFGGLAEVSSCTQQPGYVLDASDCEDGSALRFPGADEYCNGSDDDCDGIVDEASATDVRLWFRDRDGDDYGDSSSTLQACSQPTGYAASSTDCDDVTASSNPGAIEICNGADDDCDGSIDEAGTSGAPTWYPDVDRDGFGVPSNSVFSCNAPTGYTSTSTDCNDAAATTHPGAPEMCDTLDNDCDGIIDEDLTTLTWYRDADADGWGVTSSPATDCAPPSGYVSQDGDCNDSLAVVNPGITEVCGNSVDDDCDLDVDEYCHVFVYHCGAINTSQTWANTAVHVVTCNVEVSGGGGPTLTIEDGAEVRFDRGAALLVGWTDRGRLLVNGTTWGVSFTSSVASPAPGDWSGVYIGSHDMGSQITGLDLAYAGSNTFGSVYVTGSSPTFTRSTIHSGAANGIYADQGGSPDITDTIVEDNDGAGIDAESGGLSGFADNEISGNALWPMVVGAGSVGWLDDSSTFSGNGRDQVLITQGTVATDATWSVLDVPYEVEGVVRVEGVANPWLHLSDGVALAFAAGSSLSVGWDHPGGLHVEGGTLGVEAFSAQTVPQPGDWIGLSLGTQDLGSDLSGLSVAHAGASGAAIYAYGADPDLEGCEITDSAGHGYQGWASFPAISGSDFLRNAGDGLRLESTSGLATASGPTFHDNIVSGNDGYPMTLPATALGQVDETNILSGNLESELRVTGDTLDQSATWYDIDAPLLITGDIVVEGTASPVLTIRDGLRLLFDPGIAFQVGWNAPGGLVVQGSTIGVEFTSSSASPQAGDWEALYLGSQAGTVTLDGLTLEYAGGNGVGGLYVYGANVDLDDSRIRYNLNDGIQVDTGSLDMANCRVDSNTGNGVHIVAPATLSNTFRSDVITLNAAHPLILPAGQAGRLSASSFFTGNGINAVLLMGDTVETSATWPNLDTDYEVSGDIFISGNANPVVQIEAGTALRFDSGAGLWVGWSRAGGLTARGGTGSEVLFTSSRATPAPGDWDGINLGASSIDADTVLTRTIIEYGGANGKGNVYFQQCNGTLTDSTIRQSSTWGVYRLGSTPVLSGLSYSGNASGNLY